jgi:hypothetical protein
MTTNRLEVDREDLMREATALRRRAEFRLPDVSETVIAGYRGDGALSIYFGPDPCYHFDAAGRLRRACVEGRLFRTQGNTLARLQRVRADGSVELRRHDLSPVELNAFLHDVSDRLRTVQEALQQRTAQCVREIPSGAGLAEPIAADLAQLTAKPLVLAPRIAGKR